MNEADRISRVGAILDRRVQGIFPNRDEVVGRLAGVEPLTFYLGIDPTGPLHIGHVVPLLLLKDLQELGHRAVILIGDFTARLGDPDKSATRIALTEEQVIEHMSSYVPAIQKILTPDDIRYNSEWYATMNLEKVINLTSRVTVQQLLARDMFQERLKNEKPIHVNEFLYPIMQGYDSVALRVDGEVGGNDQTFNMLVGREFEKEMIGKDKIVLAVQLLADPVTGKKMSKTEGIFIALTDTPQEIRRKVLALDDAMTGVVFKLCTTQDEAWIHERAGDPRTLKESLAEELIRMHHNEKAVAQAREKETVELDGLPLDKGLMVAGVASSVTGAHKLIDGGGVEVNGGKIETKNWKQPLKSGDEIKVGKGKFIKVK